MDAYIDLAALGEVLLASVIAGAGLVACFALGMVGWSTWEGRPAGEDGTAAVPGKPVGLVLAVVSFAVVLGGIALGLLAMLDKG